MNSKKIKYVILSVLVFVNCSTFTGANQDSFSIFDRGFTMPILAESFPQYEWNSDSKVAYEIYLKAFNEYYLVYDFEPATIAFEEAMAKYNKDARFYLRMAESLARTNEVDRALRILQLGETNIPGFINYNGIQSYINELTSSANGDGNVNTKPKGILGKSVYYLLWLPKKILSPLKVLWIF